MIELGHHDGDYLDICKNYRQVLETSTIQEVGYYSPMNSLTLFTGIRSILLLV
jgi:hypothetical protein